MSEPDLKPIPAFFHRARRLLAQQFAAAAPATPEQVLQLVLDAWWHTPLANQHRENDQLQAELEEVSAQLRECRQQLTQVQTQLEQAQLPTESAKSTVSTVGTVKLKTHEKLRAKLALEQETVQHVILELRAAQGAAAVLAYLRSRGYRNATAPPLAPTPDA